MATAPLSSSTAARENVFASKNQEVKSFVPKEKVEESSNSSNQLRASEPEPVRQGDQPKPSPVVNPQGQVTGTNINTAA